MINSWKVRVPFILKWRKLSLSSIKPHLTLLLSLMNLEEVLLPLMEFLLHTHVSIIYLTQSNASLSSVLTIILFFITSSIIQTSYFKPWLIPSIIPPFYIFINSFTDKLPLLLESMLLKYIINIYHYHYHHYHH